MFHLLPNVFGQGSYCHRAMPTAMQTCRGELREGECKTSQAIKQQGKPLGVKRFRIPVAGQLELLKVSNP